MLNLKKYNRLERLWDMVSDLGMYQGSSFNLACIKAVSSCTWACFRAVLALTQVSGQFLYLGMSQSSSLTWACLRAVIAFGHVSGQFLHLGMSMAIFILSSWINVSVLNSLETCIASFWKKTKCLELPWDMPRRDTKTCRKTDAMSLGKLKIREWYGPTPSCGRLVVWV